MAGFEKNIDWLGHASFRLNGSKTIYIDPWKLEDNCPVADIILITHSHYDHYSPDDIERIKTPETVLVAPLSDRDKIDFTNSLFLNPYDSHEIDGIIIEAVPAYNTDTEFHPRTNNWLGYVVEIDGARIYHAGDTDNIDEMENIKCDIALMPVSGTYVMTASEALEAEKKFRPGIVIPMHWGDIVGNKNDAEAYKQNSSSVVIVKEKVR